MKFAHHWLNYIFNFLSAVQYFRKLRSMFHESSYIFYWVLVLFFHIFLSKSVGNLIFNINIFNFFNFETIHNSWISFLRINCLQRHSCAWSNYINFLNSINCVRISGLWFSISLVQVKHKNFNSYYLLRSNF